MPGYTDYLLLLRPDETICREISSFKLFAAALVGDFPSMHSTAHISIIKYSRKKPYVMHQALDNLQHKLKGMPALTLQINNFNFFRHKNDTYTIYAVIEPTLQSDTWFAALTKQLHLTRGSFLPHITIARTINENCFYKLWPQFKYTNFRQHFSINSLTVLERETLNSSAKWAIYKEFLFEHKNTNQLI